MSNGVSPDLVAWQEIALSKTIKFVVDNRGKTAPTEMSGIPLIATNCISNENLYPVYENLRYVSQETYDNWFRSHPKPGDILLTLKGSQNGAACLVPDPVDFVIAQDMVALRVDEEVIDPFFLFAALRSDAVQTQIKNLDVSGVIPHLKKSDFDKLMLPYPDRDTQRSIGQLYFSLSKKIDLLHRQSKTLETMAATLFRQWFVEDAQEDWEVTSLEAHADVCRGLSYKGSGLTGVGGGLPMHNLNSILEGGGYKHAGIKYYSGELKDRHLTVPGDIIVANTEQGHEFRLIGFPAIIPSSFGLRGLFSQHIYKLTPKKQSYLPSEFFYYLLMESSVREQIISATNGSTVNMLAIDGLQLPTFKLPPRNKVTQFAEIVREWWDKKDNNRSQITTLEKLRGTLLPKLMSGEVRVEFDAAQ
jgi:type I restriction enzyme, S subunit